MLVWNPDTNSFEDQPDPNYGYVDPSAPWADQQGQPGPAPGPAPASTAGNSGAMGGGDAPYTGPIDFGPPGSFGGPSDAGGFIEGTYTGRKPGPDDGSGGGGGGGFDFGGMGGFSWPGLNLPDAFSFGQYKPRDRFTKGPYVLPSLQEAQQEPGYEFARGEGQRALQTGQAAKGILRTGGSLKDLLAWGNKFAEQNYGNVAGRKLGAWQANLNADLGLDASDLAGYGANYRNAFDTWRSRFDTGNSIFGAQQRQAEMTLQDLLDRQKLLAGLIQPT